jgi:hypothetical protein
MASYIPALTAAAAPAFAAFGWAAGASVNLDYPNRLQAFFPRHGVAGDNSAFVDTVKARFTQAR